MSEPSSIAAIFTAFLGLAVGSFLNVCIYRIPAGKSIVTPSSHCPSCGTRLKPADLIPVLSFLFLRGRCRHCRSPINPRYALTEVLTALLFVLAYLKFGVGVILIKYLFVTALLITAAFIDLEHLIIPNRIILAGIIGGAVFLPLTGEYTVVSAIYGILAVSGFLLTLNIVSRGGMGMGDVKFGAFMGITLGWPLSFLAVFLACFGAGLTGIFLLAARRKGRKDPIPFGPFLALGTLLSFMWGTEIQHLYINFIYNL